jgi:two-component system chemotaxis sensor kinase CheA
VLLVRSGGAAFALPLLGLQGLGAAVAGATPLARVLGLPCPDTAAHDYALELSHPEGAVHVAVDGAGQMQRIVRRPLPAHLGAVPCVQGATILPGGEPVLLLDLREVAEACRGEPRAPAARRRILLADDSPTLRARLRSELSAAGFEVVDSVDGQEALERLSLGGFDAVVSDVQMPRRDGFAVAERCAGRLPCLLVTAQPTPDGEARARDCGAAYLAKDERLGARVLAFLAPLLHASQGSLP